MRGRRRKQYSWFPVLGTEATFLEADDFYAPLGGQLHITPTTPFPMDVISLTWDYPTEVEEGFDTIPSLADFQGSEYQLERIVGKFFCRAFADNAQGDTAPQQTIEALVCAAFIILRVDEKTGAPLRSTDLGEYSPLISENISDPWIWRRSWMLGQGHNWPSQASIFYGAYPGWPGSNVFYGDIESGPHIDARSVRKVRKEERVFLIVQANAMGAGEPETLNEGGPAYRIDYTLDYRILGRLVKASAHGNTSR